ncbi:MAG: formimidoylglutamase [Gammaproteobacteria bacterium]|nr:formimidoylglutamase [Gammaproteobacteria bacterium]
MTWKTHYLSPDPTQWRGRSDAPPDSCFFQVVTMLDLLETQTLSVSQPTFAFIGFRCDEGVRRNGGRIGAAEGPSAIRQALAKLPVLKQNFQCIDAGNIVCLHGDLEASQHALGEVVALLLKQKINPIVLGGGHELAWGHYQGIYKAFPDKHLGIINFDSHFDMRPLLPDNKGSSGTPFLQIAEAHKASKSRFDYNCIGIQHGGNIRQLIDTAKSYDTHIIWADELYLGQMDKCIDFIDRVVDQNEIIYLSLCLDVFSAACAPGVSAIQPLGLYPWHVLPLIRQLASSGKVICYDIAEMSPRYDIDHCTSKLAAHLIHEFIHHHNDSPRHW